MKKNKLLLCLTILTILLNQLFFTLFLYSLTLFNNIDVTNPENIKFKIVVFDIAICLFLICLVWMLTFISGLLQQKLIRNLSIEFRIKILFQITNNIDNYLFNDGISESQNAFLTEANVVIENRYKSIFSLVADISGVIFLTIALLMYSWIIFITVLLLTCFIISISSFMKNKFVKLQNRQVDLNKIYISNLQSNLKGYRIFFTFNKLHLFKNRLSKINDDYENKVLKISGKSTVFKFITYEFPGLFNQMFVIILSGILLIKGNISGLGTFSAIITTIGSFTHDSSSVVDKSISFLGCRDIFNKYKDYQEVEQKSNNTIIEKIKSISFENVDINYDDKKVINSFTQKFEDNKIYLISGVSGAGKSTLVKSLVGLTKISEGKIKVNNNILNEENFNSFLQNISYVDQSTYLLNESLGFNIALSKNYDVNRINEILIMIKLNEVEGLDHSTIIGGDNDKLSGGQKQRIGIARALYDDRQIWIIDETTSNLDAINKKIIEDIILSQKNKMILMITHDLSKENHSKINEIVNL